MEIVDALTVIARPGWQQLELTVEATGDRVFASSIIESKGQWIEERADLGLDPVDVRAALDEALGDLVKSSSKKIATLSIERDGDRKCHLAAKDQADAVLFECTLDERHSNHRVFTEALYSAALAAAARIDAQQQWLASQALGHDDWEYDSRYAQLVLKKGVLPWRSFSAQMIATWAKESETLLWAWANQDLAPPSTELSRRMHAQPPSEPGLGVLGRAHIPADEGFASAMARLATARSDADAVYPAVYENGVIYLAIYKDRSGA